MATTIRVFDDRNFGITRPIQDGGRVLFCGKYVATALGDKDPTNALKLHRKGVAKHHLLETAGGTLRLRFVSEDYQHTAEPSLAIFFNQIPFSRCEVAWVHTAHIIAGMRQEVDWARSLKMPIKYFIAHFEVAHTSQPQSNAPSKRKYAADNAAHGTGRKPGTPVQIEADRLNTKPQR